jgi:hypothetical protein
VKYGRDAGIVLRQAAHMHFVDDVVLLSARRLGPDTGVVGWQNDPLRGLAAAVECAIASAGRKHRAIAVLRIDWIVTELARIWIDEQLVRIEAIAGGIDVSDEPRGRSRRLAFDPDSFTQTAAWVTGPVVPPELSCFSTPARMVCSMSGS